MERKADLAIKAAQREPSESVFSASDAFQSGFDGVSVHYAVVVKECHLCRCSSNDENPILVGPESVTQFKLIVPYGA